MNEQDISKAVEAVLGQMNGQHAHHGEDMSVGAIRTR